MPVTREILKELEESLRKNKDVHHNLGWSLKPSISHACEYYSGKISGLELAIEIVTAYISEEEN